MRTLRLFAGSVSDLGCRALVGCSVAVGLGAVGCGHDTMEQSGNALTSNAVTSRDAGRDDERSDDAHSGAVPAQSSPPLLATSGPATESSATQVDPGPTEAMDAAAVAAPVDARAGEPTEEPDGDQEIGLPVAFEDAGPLDAGSLDLAVGDPPANGDEADGAAAEPSRGDAAAACVIPEAKGSECALGSDCGCDEGKVCRQVNAETGQTLCFTPGASEIYGLCKRDQDCGAGSVCEAGICRAPCNNPGGFCEDGAACSTFHDPGRSVCVGHCDPLLAEIGDTEEGWIGRMVVTGREPWSGDFVACGAGAYCHGGEGPSEDASDNPLFPYCTAGSGFTEGQRCVADQDCATGLGCSVGDPDYDTRGKVCRRLCAADVHCQTAGTGTYCAKMGSTLVGPDSFTVLGYCSE